MSAKTPLFEKLYTFSCDFIRVLSLLFTGILLLSGFAATCYSLDMETQYVLTRWDSPLWSLLGTGAFFLAFCALMLLIRRKPAFVKKILFCITTLWILGTGAILIVFSKTVPAADAFSVYDIAGNLAIGDTSVIHPTDSYLSYYPQQIGLVAFYEVLILLWNLFSLDLPAYHFIKIIYVLLGIVILYFQYRMVHLLFENDRTDCIYLLLMGANLPFIMYTSFVYGEIPSFAAMSIGIYYFLRMTRSGRQLPSRFPVSPKSVCYCVVSILFLTLSVQFRKNSLIIIIAVLLVSILLWLKERRHLLLLFAVFCTVCAVGILPLIQKGYEHRAGNTLSSGVTSLSYIAMGMQESSRANGWYNSFNFDTYQKSSMDTTTANELSRTAIRERLSYFKEHPGYAADFYLYKFLSQWVDGTYACRQATLATFGGRKPFFNELYSGSYSPYFIEYCNAFQNILYLGAFLFCLGLQRKKLSPKITGLPLYLGLIGVFGGFLFHMMWEANSRYIFLYSLMLLPYAAEGIQSVVSALAERRKTSP